jgi:cytochrome c biogenesis protein CcdA
VSGELLLALSAGMLGAVNPCGFALLPAYLSVLVVGEPGEPAKAVWRAIRCTAALTLGYLLVFGAFGLVLTPVAGALTPRLPWLTVVFGLGLAVLGGWLLAGRSLPRITVRAPVLNGSARSMVLFGMAYAIASLGCAVGPFLALVVTSLRAGSIGSGLLLFGAYAAGMGLVVGVTAVAVALVQASVSGPVEGRRGGWMGVNRVRRLFGVVPRLGGAVLLASGLYVAYYGWYELRLVENRRLAGRDPIVAAAGDVQRWLSDLVGGVGAIPLVLVLAALVIFAALRRRTGPPPDGPSGAATRPATAVPASPAPGLRRRADTR